MPLSFDDLLRNRLPHVGLNSINRGGGGDCWWHCIAAEAGISLKDLRSVVAQHMHVNEHVYVNWEILMHMADIKITAIL